MDLFKALFGFADKLGVLGFFGIWLSFFGITFGALVADEQTGPIRDYATVSQLICCANLVTLGYAVVNNVKWSKASFHTLGLDLFVTWTALAYYGVNNVFDDSLLGVWNTISTIFMGVFTVQYLVCMVVVARNYNGFQRYLNNGREQPRSGL